MHRIKIFKERLSVIISVRLVVSCCNVILCLSVPIVNSRLNDWLINVVMMSLALSTACYHKTDGLKASQFSESYLK